MRSKKIAQKILRSVDVEVNGNRPWDIQVHNDKFYSHALANGSRGFGEAYVDGWWDSDDMAELVNRLLKTKNYVTHDIETLITVVWLKLFNAQRKKAVIAEHYDLGNDLYESFLDPYMQYSVGYKNVGDLNTSQEEKLKFLCEKLQLKKGDRVLDIGCGWGGLAKYAAENYDCHVTGVTLSHEQMTYAKKLCESLPVSIIQKDYIDVEDKFDKIFACEMIEHVGHNNYRKFMKKVHSMLKDDGLALILASVGENKAKRGFDPWLEKYLWPGGMIPSNRKLNQAMKGLLIINEKNTDVFDYDKTLLRWFDNFERNWSNMSDKYDERFYRMWKCYLLMCAGSFRAGLNKSTLIILSKK